LVRAVAVRLLALALWPFADLGWYASKGARWFLTFHAEYVHELRISVSAYAKALGEAKSELDLLVARRDIHDATDALLRAADSYVALVTGKRAPQADALEDASDALGLARKRLRAELSKVIRPAVRQHRGRGTKASAP